MPRKKYEKYKIDLPNPFCVSAYEAPRITLKEVVTEVSKSTGLRHDDTALIISAFLDTLKSHLKAGHSVGFEPVGNIELRIVVAAGKAWTKAKLKINPVLYKDLQALPGKLQPIFDKRRKVTENPDCDG